jgi:hypothetical protein
VAHVHKDVITSVKAHFPEQSWERVLVLLETYGVESYERERERVQLALVKLSGGSEEKLRECVTVAKEDYRDILAWADSPEEARIDTPEKKKQVRELLAKLGIDPPKDL